jgi:hypothetical protein
MMKKSERVIGYVGAESPVELIIAADALPLRLRGLVDGATPHADEYLERSFVPQSRSIAEQWLTGALDFLEAVVFPRSDDSAQRLYYYMCELRRRKRCGGPEPLLYDIAAIERSTSREYTIEATRRLASSLRVQESKLADAIQRVARREALIQRATAADHLGSAAFRLARASSCDWHESFDAALAAHVVPPAAQRKRLILAGSSPPDDRLHLAVEAGGGTIARTLTEATPPAIGAATNVWESIAERYRHTLSPALSMRLSSQWLVDQARETHASGAILWLIEEDEALPWEVAAQVRALESARIPVLNLTRQAWRASPVTLDAVREFAASLGTST